jgi:AAA+ ATPase superfamily predicted ATPase
MNLDFLNEEYPSRVENMQSLFKSLSKEEAALAKLIRLEAEKIKGFAGDYFDFPFAHTPDDILKFAQSTKRISELIILKGLFLNQKLQNILLLDKKCE